MNLIFLNVTNTSSLFLGEADFTHTTQNREHGAPSSQRITVIVSPDDGVWEGVGNIT
jgi:hypothetical protein